MNNNNNKDTHSSTFIEMNEDSQCSHYIEQQTTEIEKSATSDIEFDEGPTFRQLKSDYGWKHAILTTIMTYFPHYTLNKSGT